MPATSGFGDARVLDDDDVLKLLSSSVKSAGSQIAFSSKGVERTHLNKVLNGRRAALAKHP
jgi:hypothetical protein